MFSGGTGGGNGEPLGQEVDEVAGGPVSSGADLEHIDAASGAVTKTQTKAEYQSQTKNQTETSSHDRHIQERWRERFDYFKEENDEMFLLVVMGKEGLLERVI